MLWSASPPNPRRVRLLSHSAAKLPLLGDWKEVGSRFQTFSSFSGQCLLLWNEVRPEAQSHPLYTESPISSEGPWFLPVHCSCSLRFKLFWTCLYLWLLLCWESQTWERGQVMLFLWHGYPSWNPGSQSPVDSPYLLFYLALELTSGIFSSLTSPQFSAASQQTYWHH